MKMKVSEYIADFMVKHGITQVFTVVGGGAMYMNDAFGHHPQMQCLYNHHEQASAMAAEAYARLKGRPALLCVTSGPGAINALNGVAGAYQDSIPMLVVSGQMKSSLTVRASGLNLRTLGGQEFDIVSALDKMTKYAEMVMNAEQIRYCLEKAWILATTGRQGPCWLDVPVDIQGSYVETDDLPGYEKSASLVELQASQEKLASIAKLIAERLRNAERPVIYAGNGIRWSGAAELLLRLSKNWRIPVVTCWDSIDLMPTDSPYYCGRGGTMGDRAGNFAVQNSDLLICIGSRLNIYQVGYNVKTWARAAYTVVVDIDTEELRKKTIRVDLPVCADAGDFLRALLAVEAPAYNEEEAWLKQCKCWKGKYPVVRDEQKALRPGAANVYAFMDALSRALPRESVTVVTNGSASVVGSQSYYIKEKDRFLINCGISSMGYGLPAAIGACIASEKKQVVCIEGDGSLMMNLQELQTVVTNSLPVKLFIINNNGYHQIRQTQNNLFNNGLVGVGPESGDLGFPDFGKIASAFGIPYLRIGSNAELPEGIHHALSSSGAIVCEIMVTTEQKFEPKSATKKLSDGTLVSPPLEDMSPFLSREELAGNMYIPLIPEA